MGPLGVSPASSGFYPLAILLQGIVVACVRPSVRRSILVRTITRQGFKLESPNSHIMCILGPYRTLLKMGSIDLDLQGHFGLRLTDFRKFELVCAINSSRIRPRNSIFARNVYLGTLQNPIENGVDQP